MMYCSGHSGITSLGGGGGGGWFMTDVVVSWVRNRATVLLPEPCRPHNPISMF